jgi:hypothetical protein
MYITGAQPQQYNTTYRVWGTRACTYVTGTEKNVRFYYHPCTRIIIILFNFGCIFLSFSSSSVPGTVKTLYRILLFLTDRTRSSPATRSFENNRSPYVRTSSNSKRITPQHLLRRLLSIGQTTDVRNW